MSIASPFKRCQPGSSKLLGLPVLMLSIAISTANADNKPSLFIPLGSYLEKINIAGIYFDGPNVFFKPAIEVSLANKMLDFTPQDTIPDPKTCWALGFDLFVDDHDRLSCDTITKHSPINAGHFFYSVLPPYGSYLETCIGVLKTREQERKYLYASCLKP